MEKAGSDGVEGRAEGAAEVPSDMAEGGFPHSCQELPRAGRRSEVKRSLQEERASEEESQEIKGRWRCSAMWKQGPMEMDSDSSCEWEGAVVASEVDGGEGSGLGGVATMGGVGSDTCRDDQEMGARSGEDSRESGSRGGALGRGLGVGRVCSDRPPKGDHQGQGCEGEGPLDTAPSPVRGEHETGDGYRGRTQGEASVGGAEEGAQQVSGDGSGKEFKGGKRL